MNLIELLHLNQWSSINRSSSLTWTAVNHQFKSLLNAKVSVSDAQAWTGLRYVCSIHVKGCWWAANLGCNEWWPPVHTTGSRWLRCRVYFCRFTGSLSVPLEPAPNLEPNMRSTQNYRHLEPQRGKQFVFCLNRFSVKTVTALDYRWLSVARQIN